MIKFKREQKYIVIPNGLGSNGGASEKDIKKAREEGFIEGEQTQKDKLINISITENGVYSKEDGYKEVTVVVPDKYDEGYQKGYENGEREGYLIGVDEGIAEGKEAQKEKLTTLEISNIEGIYEREDGWNKVIVSKPEPELNGISLNTTYIPLDYIPSNKTKVVTKMAFNGAQDDLKMIFGVFSTMNTPSFCVWRENTGKISRQYNKLNGSTSYTLSPDNIIEIEYSKNGLFIDGVKLADNNTTVFTCSTPIYVNYESGYSSPKWSGNTSFYYFKVYEDDVLVLDLVPFVNADGYGCLKDEITGTIYNAVDETKAIPVYGGGEYDRGYTDGKQAQKNLMTELTVTENGTYEREDGYKKVTVNVEGGGEELELTLEKQYVLNEETMRIEYSPIMKAFLENDKTLQGYSKVRLPQGMMLGMDNAEGLDYYLGTLSGYAFVNMEYHVTAKDIVELRNYIPEMALSGELKWNNFLVNVQSIANGELTPLMEVNLSVLNDGGVFSGEYWNIYGLDRWHPITDRFMGLNNVAYIDDDIKVTQRIVAVENIIQTNADLEDYMDGLDRIPRLPINSDDSIKGLFIPYRADNDIDLSQFTSLELASVRYIVDKLAVSANGSNIKFAPQVLDIIPNDVKAIIYSKNWNIQ